MKAQGWEEFSQNKINGQKCMEDIWVMVTMGGKEMGNKSCQHAKCAYMTS